MGTTGGGQCPSDSELRKMGLCWDPFIILGLEVDIGKSRLARKALESQ
jgi:hypothetical protein